MKRSWVAPVLVAVLAGVCYYALSGPFVRPEKEAKTVLAAPNPANASPANASPAAETDVPAVVLDGPVAPAEPADAPLANPVALEYAAAYQQGRWDDVIRLTCWMQDRLAQAGPQDRTAAATALRERSSDRPLEGNQLRKEGVEDRYVFAPGTTVEPIGMDQGRENLARPVKDRTWVRVSYAARASALRDEDGLPIRSLVVGINVSEDGLVLKANVVGNLDIDADSIQTYWSGISKEKRHGADKLPQM